MSNMVSLPNKSKRQRTSMYLHPILHWKMALPKKGQPLPVPMSSKKVPPALLPTLLCNTCPVRNWKRVSNVPENSCRRLPRSSTSSKQHNIGTNCWKWRICWKRKHNTSVLLSLFPPIRTVPSPYSLRIYTLGLGTDLIRCWYGVGR